MKGNVYVHYVDVNGNKIKDDVTDEKDQPVDKDYDTVVDNRPSTIEFQGKTYELVPAGNYKVGQVDEQGHWTGDDATTGKVIEGDKNVTYVYKLVDTTPEKPVTPTPGKPEQPTPGKPVDPAPKATPVKPAQEMAQLPNTGEESNVAATAALGLLATASGLALAAKRKKTEE